MRDFKLRREAPFAAQGTDMMAGGIFVNECYQLSEGSYGSDENSESGGNDKSEGGSIDESASSSSRSSTDQDTE